jgi:hypothetical protein
MFPSWLAAHQELQARVEAFEDSSRLRVSPLSSDSYGGAELHIIIIMKIRTGAHVRISSFSCFTVLTTTLNLVGGIPTPSSVGMIIPNILIYGKIKFMFQTTNQQLFDH